MQLVGRSMPSFIFKALAVGSRRGLSRRASMKPHWNMSRTTPLLLRCCDSVRPPNCSWQNVFQQEPPINRSLRTNLNKPTIITSYNHDHRLWMNYLREFPVFSPFLGRRVVGGIPGGSWVGGEGQWPGGGQRCADAAVHGGSEGGGAGSYGNLNGKQGCWLIAHIIL